MYDDHDPDAPIPFDTKIEENDDLITCNECGANVYAFGDRCPKCGYWIVEGESARKVDLRRPYRNTKLIAAGLLLLLGLYVLMTLYQLLN